MAMQISLTDDERRLLFKILESQTKSHAERGRTRKLLDAFKIAKLRNPPEDGTVDATTAKAFEIAEDVRKAAEDVCKNTTMQGNPFLQGMLYDMGEKFTAPKSAED
jgi:hypothetical protein